MHKFCPSEMSVDEIEVDILKLQENQERLTKEVQDEESKLDHLDQIYTQSQGSWCCAR